MVETQSQRCVERIRGRETCPSLQLNLCGWWIEAAERAHHLGERCESSNSSGVQLEGVQDGVISYV